MSATTNNPEAVDVDETPQAVETKAIAPIDETSTAAAPAADAPIDVEAVPARRRRRPLLWIGIVALAGGAAAAAWFVLQDDGDDVAADDRPVIEAVTAEVRDLVEFTELEGTFGFPDSFPLSPRADGTITELAAEGQRLVRGDVLWAIDDEPTVLFYGDTPSYRPLSDGAEGDDVQVLEENLAALGYTDDGDLIVDEVYDLATVRAVEAWQEDLDTDVTGTVEPSTIHVEAGPIVVESTTSRAGDIARAGSPVVQTSLIEETQVILATAGGLITDVAAPGTALTTGSTLYEIDTIPIPIVVGEPIERELRVDVEDGEDIEAFEQVLLDLGYDADGELTVDETWDEFTSDALQEWETDLGYAEDDVDGILQLDQFVFIPAPATIDATEVERGEEIVRGTAIGSTNEATQVVSTEVAVADRDQLALGSIVAVELPDGSVVDGEVTWVSASSTTPQGVPDADPVIAVEVTLAEVPESIAAFDEVDVEIQIVDSIAESVVTVPASAIISTGSAFAVEIVDGTTIRQVEVETGMFADGFVEVIGIEAGTAVVVPS